MHRILTLGLLVAAAPAMGQSGYRDGGFPPQAGPESVKYAYADVLRVDPIYETVRYREPREECRDQQVERVERTGGDGTGGTIVGAIIGGVIGSNVGSGNGRRAATAAGAVIGGAVGRDIDKNRGGPERRYVSTEQRCQVVDVEREERRIAGYDVEYQFKGDVYMSRLAYDPGNKLRVRVAVSPAD
ncbi:glycine zipper 2TM domain-containing protein [Pseudomarimonas salicorniae]|uniref:Glycine zipper 2TM domain-containing protein n=1 Tax=Pseudomarimonas salicorniae TaxID=2933270 RepID=A0ABT0GLG8_9GAMM|nr:glycine zipper 2TM domain-containing protein [Lysobacter sp. CAU 1642]MCK7595391.1 glycine zipper 2TM domain-containing protein [Lysobacter sp. CAU 1642]